jgi:alpha-L-fucosidase 2
MRNRFLLLLAVCTPVFALDFQNESDPMFRLWYLQPATDWEKEALPIGNGRIGGMVFGGTDSERVQIAEKSLWTGGPGTEGGYDYGLPATSQADLMRSIGKQLVDGAQLAPEAVAKQLGRKMHNYGDYQSFGDLIIEREGAAGNVENYRRELDLQEGVAYVRFEQGGVRHIREYFVSYPDQVLVAHLASTGNQKLRVRFVVPDNRSADVRADKTRLRVTGALKSNGLQYAAILRVVTECGTVTPDEHSLRVESACPVTIIVAARTNYEMRHPNYRAAGTGPADVAAADVLRAAEARHDSLLERHRTDHQELFGRVWFSLDSSVRGVPTDLLRSTYGQGNAAADRLLETLYFNYGRYLLIASSRPGSLPANLQGVWNDKATPPWNADYHVNINLQMNYWPAEVANLSETTAPLFDFVDHLVPPGRLAARRYFGAPGWTMFLNTNAWGYVGPIDWPTAFWQPEASAWLAQHYWEHYQFTLDEGFLRKRAWPVMKEASEFWLAALVADPKDGKLLVSPSYSPEHGPFTAGASMSQQIVADLFTNTRRAAQRVGEAAFARRLDVALQRLDPGLRIGRWGQLQEWRVDLDDQKDDHRHVSHLFALHPGHAIDVERNPDLAAAARKTLDARGDASTGWSRAWKINFWARLRDGDRAHRLLEGLLRDSTLPNLWDTHPPFQIDGNFGATAGMTEMLVQSQNGEIHILPALPRAWPRGYVRGLRVRGDATVSIEWDECGVRSFDVKAGHDGPITLRSPLFDQEWRSASGKVWPLQGKPAEKGGRHVWQARAHEGLQFARAHDQMECKRP